MDDLMLYQVLGYLANPAVKLQFDVQVPHKKIEEFRGVYVSLTGEQPSPPGYSELGINTNKRAVQYRFSYISSGMPPVALSELSKKHTAHRLRVSNKDLLLSMFEFGFLIGSKPNVTNMLKKIGGSWHVAYEFGFAAAMIDQNDVIEFEEFSSGFQAISDKPQTRFLLFEKSKEVQVVSVRTGRSAAFRHHVLAAYNQQCCVCEQSLVDPAGNFETEAAHIVPKSEAGVDDVRNGLALCKQHHWAFDRGMFGIDASYNIIVPDKVARVAENKSLLRFRNQPIGTPNIEPHPSALEWHRNHVLV